MKKLLGIFAICFSMSIAAQEYSAMTYNIRVAVDTDGKNAWEHRRESLVDQIQFTAPDILGIQEGLKNQVKFLKRKLNNYHYIGHGRDRQKKGEFSAIFYNKKKLEVLKEGTFWLSETPKEFSSGWDASLPRICTYGLFRDLKNNGKFWVFNTHFDHMGEQARMNSAQLILKMIKELTSEGDIVLLMGDLNAVPESKPIAVIKKSLNDCRSKAKLTFGPENTFNGFNFHEPTKNRIDYIFSSKNKNLKINKYAVLNNSLEQRYISDHFPVFVEFQIK